MLGRYLNTGNIAPQRSPGGLSTAQWLFGADGCGGLIWPDVTGQTAGATVSSAAKWMGSPGSPTLAEVEASGGNGVSLSLPYTGGVSGVTYGDSWVLSFWFTALSFGSGTYNCVIDESNRWLSAFYNSSGVPSFAGSFGTLVAGVRYRLSVVYPSTGTPATIAVRYYTNGVFVSTFSPSSDPFISAGTTMPVSLGANPSGGGTGFVTARYGSVRYLRYQSGSSTTTADQVATYEYRDAVLGYPDTINRWSRRAYLFGTSGSTPVTVALTGQGFTSAGGTLAPTATLTLTGSSSTSAIGTLTPAASSTLTGSYVTAYGPTSIPCPAGQARQYDVGPFTGGTGDFATLSGTVRVSRDTAYDFHGDDPLEWRVGYSGTSGPWTIVFLWAYTGSPGVGTRRISISATAPGSLLLGYSQDTGLTDCCGTYSTFLEDVIGTGTPPSPPDVAPVGLCEGCGDMLPSADVAQTGQAATTTTGSVTYSLSAALTGLSVTLSSGTLTPETGYVLSLTGQELITAAGTVTATLTTTLTGNNATGAAGTLVPGVGYTLTGQEVTSAAGSVTCSLVATLTGEVSTATTGTLTADLLTALTGNGDTTTFTGTLTPALAAAITGLSTAPTQGTIDPFIGQLVPLTGQSVTVSLGTLGVSITAGLTGTALTAAQGTITATVHVPFGELYGKWQYPRPKTGSWAYTTPKTGKWQYPDELVGQWTPVA